MWSSWLFVVLRLLPIGPPPMRGHSRSWALLFVALTAACVRAPEVPLSHDPSRADAPEGVASPLTPLGAARAPVPDATRTADDDPQRSHHGHGAHGPTEGPP